MNNELVSIIIPVYNASKYLKETLESVLSQTYSNWECIIIDDGSTDSSKDIIKEYCEMDDRFRYYYQENTGASSARNTGINISKGEYIQYLDADDVILPNKIELMVTKSEALHESNVILYCNMFLGKDNNIHERIPLKFALNLGHDLTFDETYRKFALDFGITPTCFLFPRKAIINVEWNVELGPGEDWDYFLQILNKNYIFRFINETLVLYRNTPGSHSKRVNNSFKSYYKTLAYWAFKKNKNLMCFSKRCALVYKKSVFLYLLKRTDKISIPRFNYKRYTFSQRLYLMLIYPITLFYVFSEIIRIILRRLRIISN